ncbi:hypothetical protein [Lachnospira multipara]|uniref:hypothetical protein n=1 Tax=Lachnospira multipara TaxID=28051 RepID=UPI00042586CF|nr:hypothetical protein [Lachnospira multipara]
MKKNKLITTLLISTLALSSLLTACGTKKNTSENTTELVTEATPDTLTSADGSSVEGVELEGLTFNSEAVDMTDEMNQAIENSGFAGTFTSAVSFDFNITDANNEKVQPNGTVSITKALDTLELPEGYSVEYKVYYYNPDTKMMEACETSNDGNVVTFSTTHFSVYSYYFYYFNANKDLVTNILTTDEGVKFFTGDEYAKYMIEEDEKAYQAEQAAKAQAQAEAQAQASSSNSTSSSTSNTTNEVADNSSSSTNESSNDTSVSDSSSSSSSSQYIKAINILDGRDLTDAWQITWSDLHETKNPRIYAQPSGYPGVDRIYVFNEDLTIAQMCSTASGDTQEKYDQVIDTIWQIYLKHAN